MRRLSFGTGRRTRWQGEVALAFFFSIVPDQDSCFVALQVI